MENGSTTTYTTDATAMNLGTIHEMMARNVGKYIVCELLIGLRSMTVREGVLIEVGKSYFVLQNPNNGDSTSCDLYSLKFMTVPSGSTQTTQYCPYGYTKPTCTQSGGVSSSSACWIRVD
ncbi:MAG: hypothetical protein RRZ24_11750 [Clostridia bacterium]